MNLDADTEDKFVMLQEEAASIHQDLLYSSPQSIGQDAYDTIERIFVDLFKRQIIMSDAGDFLLPMELALQSGQRAFFEMLEIALMRPEILLFVHDIQTEQTLLGYIFEELSRVRDDNHFRQSYEACAVKLIDELVNNDLLMASLTMSAYERDLKHAIYSPVLLTRILGHVPIEDIHDALELNPSNTVLSHAFMHMYDEGNGGTGVNDSIHSILDTLKRDYEVAQRFLEQKNFYGTSSSDQTYLHVVIDYFGNYDIIKKLADLLDDEVFVELSEHADSDGNTPALVAAAVTHPEAMRAILERAYAIETHYLSARFTESLNHVSDENETVLWALFTYITMPRLNKVNEATAVLRVIKETGWLKPELLEAPIPVTVRGAKTQEDLMIRTPMLANAVTSEILASNVGGFSKRA